MKEKPVLEVKRPTFIDIKSDFGFKRCMSDPIVMKSFLNAILSEDYGKIEQIHFENVEMAKERMEHRGVRFDLRCTLDNGDDVLIEMQNYGHRYFKTRANYYLCRLMCEHIQSDIVWRNMDHDIPRLIGIFILGVPMMDLTKPVTVTAECDLDTQEEFWDRQRKYFISLPHFEWGEDMNAPTSKEVWMEIFKNLGTMTFVNPKVYEMADEGLRRLIDKARVSRLSGQELAEYEAGMKDLSDYGTAEAYGYDNGFRRGLAEGNAEGLAQGIAQGIAQGRAEGHAEGKSEGVKEHAIQVARMMLDHQKPMDEIILFSGLTKEEIEQLKEE